MPNVSLPVETFEVVDSTPSRHIAIDKINIGQSVVQRVVFTEELMRAFVSVANDRAPLHTDPRFAKAAKFDAPLVQGLALASRFSRLIGMYLPGEGAILEGVELKYRRPVYVGQELIYRCTVTRILRPIGVVRLSLNISSEGSDYVTGQCQCLVR